MTEQLIQDWTADTGLNSWYRTEQLLHVCKLTRKRPCTRAIFVNRCGGYFLPAFFLFYWNKVYTAFFLLNETCICTHKKHSPKNHTPSLRFPTSLIWCVRPVKQNKYTFEWNDAYALQSITFTIMNNEATINLRAYIYCAVAVTIRVVAGTQPCGDSV
jgi:hypothetical protein